MKTIGMLAGMSWESTVPYYRIINETIREELGGLHSAKILLYSVDFAEIEAQQAKGEWDKSAALLSHAAKKLEECAADLLIICSNTMHKIAPAIQAEIGIPLLHIAEATALELKKQGIQTVALLGTKYTMTQDFYKERIRSAGIDVVVPDAADIEIVNRVIYEELCIGKILPSSKQEYLRIVSQCKKQGAQAVILGCTEIGFLIQQSDLDIPVFDTTQIHARQAAYAALCTLPELCPTPGALV